MNPTILLTGANGQVGRALQHVLQDHHLIVVDRNQCDLSLPAQIRAIVRQHHPDIIINTAAHTAVDKAEAEAELAYAINATAPQILAEEALTLKATLIHFSTDYVFDGTKSIPYQETDSTQPISVYGKSKLKGEHAIQAIGGSYLILRTSWVYAPWGRNFLNTMLRLAKEREQISVINDQYGAPTSALAIANGLRKVLTCLTNKQKIQNDWGVYHFTNAGFTSWYDFAIAIFKHYETGQVALNWPKLNFSYEAIKPICTEQYPTPAKRPPFSMLDNTKLKQVFGVELPHWKDSLTEVMSQLNIEK